jgi:hypothetical protein
VGGSDPRPQHGSAQRLRPAAALAPAPARQTIRRRLRPVTCGVFPDGYAPAMPAAGPRSRLSSASTPSAAVALHSSRLTPTGGCAPRPPPSPPQRAPARGRLHPRTAFQLSCAAPRSVFESAPAALACARTPRVPAAAPEGRATAQRSLRTPEPRALPPWPATLAGRGCARRSRPPRSRAGRAPAAAAEGCGAAAQPPRPHCRARVCHITS